MDAIDLFARKRRVGVEVIIHEALQSRGPSLSGSTVADTVRFHDDPNAYTGVYARGGPTAVAHNEKITLSSLADRSKADVRGRKIAAHKRHTVRAADPRHMAPGANPVVRGRRLSDHGRDLFMGAHRGGEAHAQVQSTAPRRAAPQAPRQAVTDSYAYSGGYSGRGYAQQESQGRSPAKKKGGGNIFDRLTDTSQYTGAHKHRFDAQGRGRGLAGRDRVGKGVGYIGTSRGFAGHGRSGDGRAFVGNTNTGTNTVYHDSSQFLMRR